MKRKIVLVLKQHGVQEGTERGSLQSAARQHEGSEGSSSIREVAAFLISYFTWII